MPQALANVSPLVAEQLDCDTMRLKTLPSGETVILDPAATSQRVFNWFYAAINIGALVGELIESTRWTRLTLLQARSRWCTLSGTRVTGLRTSCPRSCSCSVRSSSSLATSTTRRCARQREFSVALLTVAQNPPGGDVISVAYRAFRLAAKGKWTSWKAFTSDDFWEQAKPSNIAVEDQPRWMVRSTVAYTDEFVDELKRGFAACRVFLLYPAYWLAYNQASLLMVCAWRRGADIRSCRSPATSSRKRRLSGSMECRTI